MQAVLQGRLALGLGVSHHWIIDEMLGPALRAPGGDHAGPPRRARPGPRGAGPGVDVENELFRVHNPIDVTDVGAHARC